MQGVLWIETEPMHDELEYNAVQLVLNVLYAQTPAN